MSRNGETNIDRPDSVCPPTTVQRSAYPLLSRLVLYMAAPAMLVVTPLTGLALHSDQRIAIYQFAVDLGANPIRIIRENISEIGHFIQKGNFRPAGRFFFYLEESARFEIAMTLGIPPHVVQGLLRVLMIGLLALVIPLMIYLRGKLAGITRREVLSSTAVYRFLVFLSAFLLVFIPSRLAIAKACTINDCYGNTELAMTNLSIGQWLGRSVSGFPLLEWIPIVSSHTIRGIAPVGLRDIVGNVWLLFVAVAFAVMAIRASKQLVAEVSQHVDPAPYRYLGVSLIVFGTILALSVTLIVSSAEGLQTWNERGQGLHQWRDTLLVQVSWAFILYGVLVLVASRVPASASSRRPARIWLRSGATLAVAVCFTIMLVLTLSANDQYAKARRSRPDTNLVNLISAASIEFERTEEGTARRCQLIAEYTPLACESCWHSGPRLAEQLNDLSLSRYGSEFCPLPSQDDPGGER